MATEERSREGGGREEETVGRERVRKETEVARRETERKAGREGGSEKDTVEREMVRREGGRMEAGKE